jgi:hypothetical protein
MASQNIIFRKSSSFSVIFDRFVRHHRRERAPPACRLFPPPSSAWWLVAVPDKVDARSAISISPAATCRWVIAAIVGMSSAKKQSRLDIRPDAHRPSSSSSSSSSSSPHHQRRKRTVIVIIVVHHDRDSDDGGPKPDHKGKQQDLDAFFLIRVGITSVQKGPGKKYTPMPRNELLPNTPVRNGRHTCPIAPPRHEPGAGSEHGSEMEGILVPTF